MWGLYTLILRVPGEMVDAFTGRYVENTTAKITATAKTSNMENTNTGIYVENTTAKTSNVENTNTGSYVENTSKPQARTSTLGADVDEAEEERFLSALPNRGVFEHYALEYRWDYGGEGEDEDENDILDPVAAGAGSMAEKQLLKGVVAQNPLRLRELSPGRRTSNSPSSKNKLNNLKKDSKSKTK